MPRAYIRAGQRVRQIARFVRMQYAVNGLGVTIVDLVAHTGLSYQSVCAYVKRVVREQRVEAVIEDESLAPRGLQRFYPPGLAPRQRKAA